MLSQQAKDQLKKIRLKALVDADDAIEGAGLASGLSTQEYLDILIGHLFEAKMQTKLDNLIDEAGFADKGACLENLCFDADRGLDRNLIAELSTGAYIARGHNILCLSPAGGGKTYLGCAFGLAACRQFVKVSYADCRDFVDELLIAKQDPKEHKKLVGKISKIPLLIIDEWLGTELNVEAMDELFRVVDKRMRAKKSTIFCSQRMVDAWPAFMGGYLSAESIVDRVKNNAYIIEIGGEISMRERLMDEELKRYARK